MIRFLMIPHSSFLVNGLSLLLFRWYTTTIRQQHQQQQQQQQQRSRRHLVVITVVVSVLSTATVQVTVTATTSVVAAPKSVTNTTSSTSSSLVGLFKTNYFDNINNWNPKGSNQLLLGRRSNRNNYNKIGNHLYKYNNKIIYDNNLLFNIDDSSKALNTIDQNDGTSTSTYPLVIRKKRTIKMYSSRTTSIRIKKNRQQRRRKLQLLCRIRKLENCHSSSSSNGLLAATTGCIKNQDALQKAIQNAVPKTERLPTTITLCNTIVITNRIPLNNNLYAFDVSNKNIQLDCATTTTKTKCIIDATSTRSGILYGTNTKLIIQNIVLTNAGNRTNGGNCLNDNDYSHPCGGAIHFINNSNITIINSTFSNHASKLGGAISVTNSVLSITSSSFLNNAAIVGGAIAAGNSIMTIQHTRFEKNCCISCGGGIASYNGTIVTLFDNITFFGNIANLGGAISLIQSNLTTGTTNQQKPSQRKRIRRRLDTNDTNITLTSDDYPILTPTATFIQNSASEGGAIDASDSVLSMDGILFDSNIASERGGALSLRTSNGQFVNCFFVSNQAESEGGAVLLMSNTSSQMSNVRFDKNNAFVGGALDVSFDSTTSIEDGIFFKNSGSIGSAARFIDCSATIILTHVSFIYNEGIGSMSNALKTVNSRVVMFNSAFLGNRRKDDKVLANINMFGGGVTCTSVTFCIDCDGYLTPIACVNSTIATGGGVVTNCITDGLIGISGEDVCVQPPLFIDDESSLATAIQDATSFDVTPTRINLRNPLIEITSNWYGISTHSFDISYKSIELSCGLNTSCILSSKDPNMGIFYGEKSKFVATFVTFANGGCKGVGCGGLCTLASGGAINFLSSELFFSYCSFINNTATSGGAMYVSKTFVSIISSTFDRNVATFGGAISSTDSSVVNIGITKLQNNCASKGGSLYMVNNSTAQLRNLNTFVSNRAIESGGAIYNENSKLNGQNGCQFSQNVAREGGAVYVIKSSGTDNLFQDTQFIQNNSTDGAPIQVTDSQIHFNRVMFNKNSVRSSAVTNVAGGFESINSVVTLANCRFIANTIQPKIVELNMFVDGGFVSCKNTSFCVNCPLVRPTCFQDTIAGNPISTDCNTTGRGPLPGSAGCAL